MVDNINGINGAAGNAPVRKVRQAYQNFSQPAKVSDTVELSSDVMTVRGVDKVRLDRIMEIRQQLKDGTYLTPEKLDVALDRALSDALGSR